ncbi:ferredoxin--NAD(P)(+) reductase CarAd [Roseovarius sp. A-2]|nr:ferredoxin--NAD(P)(+) reductase CarAd [Roseovarius sp. A-2]
MQVTLKSKNHDWTFAAHGGESLLQAAMRAGLHVPYECATGTCGSCRVDLIAGELQDAWPEAPGRGDDPNARLMCQCKAVSDCEISAKGYVYSTDHLPVAADRVSGRITDLRQLTPDVIEFTVTPDTPLRYLAGQFVTLEHADVKGPRGYSMTRHAPDGSSLSFVIKRLPGGGWSEWIFAKGDALLGSVLQIVGPFGRATFSPDLGMNIACIAGGSGVAGMRAIIERGVEDGYFMQYRGALFFGVRTPKDAFWLEELDALSGKGGNKLSITIAYSNEGVDPAQQERFPNLGFAEGFVHEIAAAGLKGRFNNLRAYLAGPPPAVDAAQRMLLVEGKMSPANIRYDKFS